MKKPQAVIAQALDGFANFAAKMGLGANNVFSEGTYAHTPITRERVKLEAAYRTSWVVGAMVDVVAEDMTRSGINIMGSIEPDDSAKLQKYLTRAGIWAAQLEWIKWSRLFGGAIAVIAIDGQNLATPLDADTVAKGSFTGLTIYDRWSINPSMTDFIQSGKDMGLPTYYTITGGAASVDGGLGVKIHHTRVIRGIGIQLPFYEAQREMFWGESVVERPYDRLLAFDTATSGSANLIQRANLRTVQIKNLRGILSAGGKPEENLVKMFGYMGKFQTSEGLTLLDAEDLFQSHSYTFSGLSDMMLQFGQQVSGATGIPLVRLFGQSPAGLNSTGESDLRMYYDNILSQQEGRVRSGLTKILDIAHRSFFGAPPPDDFDFEFKSLWQTGEKEKADIAKTITESVVAAHDAGLISTACAMEALKQASAYTGVFSNIDQEDIEAAEAEAPPEPVETQPAPIAPPVNGEAL